VILDPAKASANSAFGQIERADADPYLINNAFARMVVVDVIYDPTLVTEDVLDYYSTLAPTGLRTAYGKLLPRNTVLAKFTNLNTDGNLRPPVFLFPMFPAHLSLPVSPGEHVWAMFEHYTSEIGYWLCRISEMWHVDDLNHTHPPRQFERTLTGQSAGEPKLEFVNGLIQGEGDDREPMVGTGFIPGGPTAYLDLITRTGEGEAVVNSMDLIKDAAVPRFKKRPGDLVLEGKNNSLLVLGTERRGPAADKSELKKDVIVGNEPSEVSLTVSKLPQQDSPHGGMIDMVVGRGKTPTTSGVSLLNSIGRKELDKSVKTSLKNPSEGDPDLIADDTRIRLSQAIKIDESLKIVDLNNASFSISDGADGDPGVIIKTDKVRILARKDLEILVSSDDAAPDDRAAIVVKASGDIIFRPSKSGYIKLGSDKADKALLCTSVPAAQSGGTVTSQPIVQPLATVNPDTATVTVQVGTGTAAAGTFAKKVLVDG